jgi:hypothetical protein
MSGAAQLPPLLRSAVIPPPPASTVDLSPRARLLANLESGTDRYWQLLGIINGWPPIRSVVPAFERVIAALKFGQRG